MNEALEQGITWELGRAEVLDLWGTSVCMFECHTELAWNEAELGNTLMYQYVSKNKS